MTWTGPPSGATKRRPTNCAATHFAKSSGPLESAPTFALRT